MKKIGSIAVAAAFVASIFAGCGSAGTANDNRDAGNADGAVPGPEGDASPQDDGGGMGNDAIAYDAPAHDGAAFVDVVSAEGGAPADASSTGEAEASPPCPTSCPAGQVLVNWDLSAPGYPGPSGCACKADPCLDGGTGCDPCVACHVAGISAGCCSWSGPTLFCNACG